MLLRFFYSLRAHQVPVSTQEWLSFLQLIRQHQALIGKLGLTNEDFYYLARLALVKNEIFFDRFDRAFTGFTEGLDALSAEQWHQTLQSNIPNEWLIPPELLPPADPSALAHLPKMSHEELLATLAKRLAEQKEQHHGGNRWIGTGGTSPFGHSGYNPEGIRLGGESKNRGAVKIWQMREYRNLDDQVEIGVRNIKVALRRLRQFARSGAQEELDLAETINHTAKNAGWLSIKMQRERHNSMKVLLLMDVGGSMDEYTRLCTQMFAACKTEFKHLQSFYFHNCVYEWVWRDNQRRHREQTAVFDLIHKYGKDYRLIFIGDAAMSPNEITQPWGAVELGSAEPGAVWLARLLAHFQHAVWINPEPKKYWEQMPSTRMIKNIMQNRMFALTPEGINSAVKELLVPNRTLASPHYVH